MMSASIVFVLIALLLLCSNFILYPVLLFFWRFLFPRKQQVTKESSPIERVSFIIVVHNAEQLIVDKINNILQLNLADIDYEVIVYLDGCSDSTQEKIESIHTDNIKLINEPKHLGKIRGLNAAAAMAQGDILVFTDADAIFDVESINHLLANFKDPLCGGVCGMRAIKEKQGKLHLAQQLYIRIDSYIKKLESYLGNITSNDGKLYALRRHLFRPIAEAVTDDLYACLDITLQKYHFVFEPKAIVHISTPSRGSQHESSRRRRIVTQSLHGIFLKRQLLNPFSYGVYSIGLLINKVFRRLIGAMLTLLLISSYFASSESMLLAVLFYAQLGFYLLALSYPPWLSKIEWQGAKLCTRIGAMCWYFCLGNFAALWGVFDFLSGKRVAKWQPKKQD